MRKLLAIIVLGLLWNANGYSDEPRVFYKDSNKIHVAHKTHFTEWHEDVIRVGFNYCESLNKYAFMLQTKRGGAPINKYYKQKIKSTYKGSWVTEFICSAKQLAAAPSDSFVPGAPIFRTNYGRDDKITTEDKKVEIASMIDRAKKTCKDLGFQEGTSKFADCSLKLYSQSLELAAEKKQTVVMQPQSSGSNKMTIYDPVRDANALIKQGQRMMSGACTLGINC